MEKSLNPLGREPVGRLIAKFAVPSIIAMLVGSLYNIVDQLFIGQDVGTVGNAATNIAFPFTTSCIALSLLFGIGGASCYNLTMGQGDNEKAPYYMGNALTMLTLSGILVTTVTEIFLSSLLTLFGSPADVLPYAEKYVSITAIGFPFLILTTGGCHLIRADGSPNMAMTCNLIGAVINTVLDAFFIFGLKMGIAGAALATVIGQVVSALIVIVYIWKFRRAALTKKHFVPKLRIVGKVAAIGMASFINQLAIMVVQIVLNNILRHYGSLSEFGETTPIAVSGIVMKINQIVFSIVIGLSQGAQPIESFNYGAKQYDRVRKAFKIAILIGGGVSVAAFIVFQLIPRQLISVFGSGDEGYFLFGESFFRVFLFFTWLNCLQPIIATFFTSIGKPINGVFLSLTRQFLFFLPPLLILPLFMGIDGVLFAGPIADFCSGAVAIIMAAVQFAKIRKEEISLNAKEEG
ncbi:MAG: MATE family efflux transporter [Ruminiclostridium sp.]